MTRAARRRLGSERAISLPRARRYASPELAARAAPPRGLESPRTGPSPQMDDRCRSPFEPHAAVSAEIPSGSEHAPKRACLEAAAARRRRRFSERTIHVEEDEKRIRRTYPVHGRGTSGAAIPRSDRTRPAMKSATSRSVLGLW